MYTRLVGSFPNFGLLKITWGAAAAKAAASAALAAGGHQPEPEPVIVAPQKKPRSAIVVSSHSGRSSPNCRPFKEFVGEV